MIGSLLLGMETAIQVCVLTRNQAMTSRFISRCSIIEPYWLGKTRFFLKTNLWLNLTLLKLHQWFPANLIKLQNPLAMIKPMANLSNLIFSTFPWIISVPASLNFFFFMPQICSLISKCFGLQYSPLWLHRYLLKCYFLTRVFPEPMPELHSLAINSFIHTDLAIKTCHICNYLSNVAYKQQLRNISQNNIVVGYCVIFKN